MFLVLPVILCCLYLSRLDGLFSYCVVTMVRISFDDQRGRLHCRCMCVGRVDMGESSTEVQLRGWDVGIAGIVDLALHSIAWTMDGIPQFFFARDFGRYHE